MLLFTLAGDHNPHEVRPDTNDTHLNETGGVEGASHWDNLDDDAGLKESSVDVNSTRRRSCVRHLDPM